MSSDNFAIQHWNIGDKVVADFTKRPQDIVRNSDIAEFIPHCCWKLGIRTGHEGTVVEVEKNRYARINYMVNFGSFTHSMRLEELKNPDSSYRNARAIGSFPAEWWK